MKEHLFNKADFLQNLFDAIPSYLFIVDSDVRIHHVNSSALKLLKDHPENILLQRSGEVLHCVHSLASGCGGAPACRECIIRNSVTSALEGESVFRSETKLELLSETRVRQMHFSITASPFRYLGDAFVLLVLEDVTKEKRFEEALRSHAVRLETAYRDMETFCSMAAHDLRAPLRAINYFSGLILEDSGAAINKENTELLGKILDKTVKMQRLINDLLEFSRASTKELQLSDTDMQEVAAHVYEDLKDSVSGRAVQFETKPMPAAFCDKTMIGQVFANLLLNAIKFTGQKGVARIEVAGVETGGENIYSVKDNGIGFDMQYSDRIFGSFSRLNPPEEFEGTGLGLSIVKKIIEKHGGRVWAESKANEGATFYFALPKRRSLE